MDAVSTMARRRRAVRAALVIGLLAFLAACHQPSQAQQPKPRTHTVRMEGMVFQPATITIAPGDAVVWVNKDLVPHAALAGGAEFDSKTLEFNKSFTHTFSTPREINYVCPFHPTMTGTVNVR
jgi:plastocyanin